MVRHDAQAVRPLFAPNRVTIPRNVDAIAKRMGVKYRSVAMGSDEGFDAADKALTAAM